MFIYQRSTPGLAIYSYLIGDEKSKKCAVIDPIRDVQEYIDIAKQQGLTITDILETHVHADFVSGARQLKDVLKSKPTIHCSAMGGHHWTPTYADQAVHDSDRIVLGEVVLEALHTPGHTPEHVCWLAYDLTRSSTEPCVMFTGDFLFVNDVGRPDLLGKEEQEKLAHELYRSVFERIQSLPDYAEIYPAHGAGSLCGKALGTRPTSTLGFERANNPSLKKLPEKEWISLLMDQMPPIPPYFPRMKQVNVHGPAILAHTENEIDAQKVLQWQDKPCQIVDTRSSESFAGAHIPGSISIPLGASFSSYAGWVLDPELPIILVLDSNDKYSDAVTALNRVGFDAIGGYLQGGIKSWEERGYPTAHFNTVSVYELDPNAFILDVRTDREYQSLHIPGAHHYQMGSVDDELISLLEKQDDIYLICGGGTRSTIMGSLLQKAGVKGLHNVIGGMSAWRQRHH